MDHGQLSMVADKFQGMFAASLLHIYTHRSIFERGAAPIPPGRLLIQGSSPLSQSTSATCRKTNSSG